MDRRIVPHANRPPPSDTNPQVLIVHLHRRQFEPARVHEVETSTAGETEDRLADASAGTLDFGQRRLEVFHRESLRGAPRSRLERVSLQADVDVTGHRARVTSDRKSVKLSNRKPIRRTMSLR